MGKAKNEELTRSLKQRVQPLDDFGDFLNRVNIGDQYLLSQGDVGIEHDIAIDDPLLYTVTGLSRYTCEMSRRNPRNGNIHRINVSYNTLYVKKNKARLRRRSC